MKIVVLTWGDISAFDVPHVLAVVAFNGSMVSCDDYFLFYLVYIVNLIREDVELCINVIKQLNYLYWLRILVSASKSTIPLNKIVTISNFCA